MHAATREALLLLDSIRFDARALTLASVALPVGVCRSFPAGAGASGKSTLLKQMIMIHGNGFPEASVRTQRIGGEGSTVHVRWVVAACSQTRPVAIVRPELKYVAIFFFVFFLRACVNDALLQ
jgi:hypothetical protein